MNNLDVGLHYVTATVDNIQSEYTLGSRIGPWSATSWR